jgi:hypothetical protein
LLISYQEAARRLGLRSRNSLYRKIKSGELEAFQTPHGPRVEGDGLEARWARITRTKQDSPLPLSAARVPTDAETQQRQHPAQEVADKATGASLPDYNVSRARTEFEKANLLELERKTKEGLLLPRGQVEKVWADAITIARTKLLAIPTRARQRIPHLTLDEVAILEELIRESLEDLSNGE